MAFNASGGTINWFLGHLAAATYSIHNRLKLADHALEVCNIRIPLSFTNLGLQPFIVAKRRILALNKRDLSNLIWSFGVLEFWPNRRAAAKPIMNFGVILLFLFLFILFSFFFGAAYYQNPLEFLTDFALKELFDSKFCLLISA